jgi:hypothetical protein
MSGKKAIGATDLLSPELNEALRSNGKHLSLAFVRGIRESLNPRLKRERLRIAKAAERRKTVIASAFRDGAIVTVEKVTFDFTALRGGAVALFNADVMGFDRLDISVSGGEFPGPPLPQDPSLDLPWLRKAPEEWKQVSEVDFEKLYKRSPARTANLKNLVRVNAGDTLRAFWHSQLKDDDPYCPNEDSFLNGFAFEVWRGQRKLGQSEGVCWIAEPGSSMLGKSGTYHLHGQPRRHDFVDMLFHKAKNRIETGNDRLEHICDFILKYEDLIADRLKTFNNAQSAPIPQTQDIASLIRPIMNFAAELGYEVRRAEEDKMLSHAIKTQKQLQGASEGGKGKQKEVAKTTLEWASIANKIVAEKQAANGSLGFSKACDLAVQPLKDRGFTKKARTIEGQVKKYRSKLAKDI